MKQPLFSFKNILDGLEKVIKRFPLALLFAILGCVVAINLNDYNPADSLYVSQVKLLLCCHLGLVYGIVVTTFSEARRKNLKTILRIALLGLLILFYYSIPHYILKSDWYRYILLAVLGHLLVSVAPYFGKGNLDNFWHYNKALFLRFLTAALYSAVLYAGLSLALWALNELFDMDIEGRTFYDLFCMIGIFLNTVIFLRGVPENKLQTEATNPYPKGLKIFTQYILVPIVSLYLIILLAYEAKIMVLFRLPTGWVSVLIICSAVLGILALLLIFPIRNHTENKWIRVYSKAYYWILLPLIVLLFVAIGKRVSDYGFTEERIWVTLIGIWLLLTALYFIISKKENIKLIPLSLCVCCLLSLLGGPFISLHSQRSRLKTLLKNENLLDTNGRIKNLNGSDQKVNEPIYPKMVNTLKYLYDSYGASAIQPFFQKNISYPKSVSYDSYVYIKDLVHSMGYTQNMGYANYPHVARVKPIKPTAHRVRFFKGIAPLSVGGYDYLFMNASESVPLGNGKSVKITADLTGSNPYIEIQENSVALIKIPLDSLLKKLEKKSQTNGNQDWDSDDGVQLAENNRIKVKLVFQNIRFNYLHDKIVSLNSFRFYCLVKFKQ